MKIERKFDFRPMGLAIKKAREKKGMTQEQLADIIGRDTRTVMYHENDGQHPSLDIFYQLATMFNLSVDQFFYTDMSADEAAKKRIDILLNLLSESELRLVEGKRLPNRLIKKSFRAYNTAAELVLFILLHRKAIRLALLQPLEHIVHGVEKVLVILLDLHAGDHVHQRIHVAILLGSLKNDVAQQGAVQKHPLDGHLVWLS